MTSFQATLAFSSIFTLAVTSAQAAEPAGPFEKSIAPVLAQKCVRCHNPANKKGDFSLATAEDLTAGGYVVPGDAAKSSLLELITPPADNGPPTMPKEGERLTDAELAAVRTWINAGAPWPKDFVVREKAKADASWWALQPIATAEPPTPAGIPAEWAAHPIDRFVYAKLAEKKLAPNPPADRAALLRRLTYDLIGLPPTPEELAAFIADTAPDAYEKVVDRLLASPHYGEHWGRHWLDVVRFGESNGFERNVIIDNLWPFRDYVIRSLNADKPFDRLVHEHLAGDVLGKGDPAVEVGVAFLVCGPYDNVGNQDAKQARMIRANTIDEMVRATAESFLGLTVGCARCHDHKFDPILQRDYYSLSAALAGVRHGERDMPSPELLATRAQRQAEIDKQRATTSAELAAIETAIRARGAAIAEQTAASWKRPAPDKHATEDRFEAVTVTQVRFTPLSHEEDPRSVGAARLDEFEVWSAEPTPRNVALAANGATAEHAKRTHDPHGPGVVIDGKFSARAVIDAPLVIKLAAPTSIDRVVFSSDRERKLDTKNTRFVAEYRLEVSSDGQTWKTVASSADRLPASDKHRDARLYDLAILPEERQQLEKLRAQLADLDRQTRELPAPPRWWVGTFEKADGPFHTFVGGDPEKQGVAVTASSLAVLDPLASRYQEEGSEAQRRQALARWITSTDNPLASRVLANRLWHYHFGVGIVDTPSDFGYMGGRPSHPELLDWLARQVFAHGWRWKPLHRLIVTSQTYRQAATWRESAAAVDGDSRLLWRFPPRRLSAEEIRDSMLSVAGKLDLQAGGKGFRLYQYVQDNVATYLPLDAHGPETYRRAVYHQNARAARVDLVSDFDCPDPAFAAPRRAATTSPLQALSLMNHQFTLDMSVAWAARLEREAGPELPAQVERAFRLAFGRAPRADEQDACLTLAKSHGMRAVCRAMFNANEFIHLR